MIDIQKLIKKRVLDDGDWGKDDEALERFHPSSLGYCRRQIFLSKIHAKQFAEWIKGSMQAGTNLHNWIQAFPEIRKTCFIEKTVKFPLNDKVYIKGSADIVHMKSGHVWDIKSIKTLSYVYRSAKREHVEQLNAYLIGLGSKEGEILYVQKNDLECISHHVDTDVDMFERTKKKVLDVYEQLLLWHAKKIRYCPFDKCSCYFCKNERLKPEFADIDDGKEHLI